MNHKDLNYQKEGGAREGEEAPEDAASEPLDKSHNDLKITKTESSALGRQTLTMMSSVGAYAKILLIK